jgi:hypothetical protein
VTEVAIKVDSRRLERILRAVGGPGDRLLRRRTEAVADLARRYASVHGPNMANGIVTRYPVPGSAQVVSTHPATQYVIHGTRPHVIVPRNRKALRWLVGGQPTFAKRVNHPGYKGDDFLTRAVEDSR